MKPNGINATSELISGMSSLNMYPDGDYTHIPNSGGRYISELDGNVKHGMEHFQSAMEVIMKCRKDFVVIKSAICRSGIPNEEKDLIMGKLNEIGGRL